VNTFGTAKMDDDAIIRFIDKHFDLTPAGIIRMLDLNRPIYAKTAAYGHFGRNEAEFTWERLDKVEALKHG
jgi:S-adenosylmethionine synthetase